MYERPLKYVVNVHFHIKAFHLKASKNFHCSYETKKKCLTEKRSLLNTTCFLPFENSNDNDSICSTDEEGYDTMIKVSKVLDMCEQSCHIMEIRTEEIPVFRSQIHGDFDLRDSVDFRPRLEDTAVSTATLGSASVNPVESFVTTRPSGGLTNPVPASTFTTDYNYYRGKSLRVVLDGDGIFRVLEGAYGDNPIIPSPPEGTMSLATINLPPYPCLSPHRAKQVGRPDYGATVKQISNKN